MTLRDFGDVQFTDFHDFPQHLQNVIADKYNFHNDTWIELYTDSETLDDLKRWYMEDAMEDGSVFMGYEEWCKEYGYEIDHYLHTKMERYDGTKKTLMKISW